MATRHRGTAREERALNAFITLQRAAETVAAVTSRHLTQHRLSESQFGVLEALHHLGPLAQKELGIKLLKTAGNITMVIDNLEKRGLVRRISNADDRRSFLINLTTKGERLIEEVFPVHLANIVAAFESLSVAEQETLRKLCRKLGTSMSEG